MAKENSVMMPHALVFGICIILSILHGAEITAAVNATTADIGGPANMTVTVGMKTTTGIGTSAGTTMAISTETTTTALTATEAGTKTTPGTGTGTGTTPGTGTGSTPGTGIGTGMTPGTGTGTTPGSATGTGTTPGPTLSTAITTPRVSSTPTREKTVGLFLKFNKKFDDKLNDKNSPQFKELAAEIKNPLSNAFRKQFPNSFWSVEVKSFSNGSTKAVIESKFATTISSTELPQATEILLTITSNIVNNTLGKLRINPENVQVENLTIYDISSVNVTIIFDLINYPYSVNLDNLTSPNAQNLIKEANDELEKLIGVDIKVLSVTTNSIGNNTDGMVHLNNTAALNITTLPNKTEILNAIVQGIGDSMLLGSSNLEVPVNSVIVGGVSSGIKAVPIFFKLVDETFNNELEKKKSTQFKTLSGKVLSGLTFALKNTNPMRVVLQRFRNGSVQCESLAWYSEKAPPTQDIISALEKNINKQTFILGNSNLKVNWTSFDIEGNFPAETGCSPGEQFCIALPTWAIALIVIAILVLIAIIIFAFKRSVAIKCCKAIRKKCCKAICETCGEDIGETGGEDIGETGVEDIGETGCAVM